MDPLPWSGGEIGGAGSGEQVPLLLTYSPTHLITTPPFSSPSLRKKQERGGSRLPALASGAEGGTRFEASLGASLASESARCVPSAALKPGAGPSPCFATLRTLALRSRSRGEATACPALLVPLPPQKARAGRLSPPRSCFWCRRGDSNPHTLSDTTPSR